MKKTITIIFTLLFIATFGPCLNAIETGIKGGIGNHESFKIGVYSSFKIGRNFEFQPELYFSQTRYNIKETIPTETWMAELYVAEKDTINTLEFPILLKWKINVGGTVTPYILGGGYGALRLGKEMIKDPENCYDGIYCLPYSEREYTLLEAGALFGVGIGSVTGKITIHFDIRYQTSFSKIQTINVYGWGINSHTRHRPNRLSVMVGVGF